MSIQVRLICDQCGEQAPSLYELRFVGLDGHSYEPVPLYRGDLPEAHLDWKCIVAYVARRDAEKETEPPF